MTEHQGPLTGIKLVDLSQVIAGPYGPSLLADTGADVIKVETLQGEIARGLASSYLSLNRGKRGISLDLQQTAGKDVLYRLAGWADVLVENFRPGVVNRLKVDYETLRAINPRLIYLSVSAFGATGPYAHRPGFDPLLQAMTGTERAQGGRHNPPVFLRIAITDYVTAMTAAAAITFALYQREKTRHGEHLHTSLLRNGLFINAEAFTRYPGRPERVLPDAGQYGLGPLDRMYQTLDGWLFIYVEGAPSHFEALRSVTGIGSELGIDEPDALADALSAVFATRTTEAWLEALEAAGVPAAPVVEHYDGTFFEDIQPIVNGYVVTYEHANRGHIEHPGNFIRFGGAPTSQTAAHPAPLLGQDTDAILMELGYGEAEIAAMRSASVIL